MTATERLQVSGLSYEYREETRGQQFCVLDGLSFEVRSAELFVILGPSGCGKTTLLNLIAAFIPKQEGQILIDGVPKMKPGTDCVLVAQELSLFEWKTALDNVAFGLKAQALPRRERIERALYYLELVKLAESANKYPQQLSGGMRQRLALARGLAVGPKVMLLDEPFGALDRLSRREMQDEFLSVHQTTKLTSVLVTHDIEEAAYLADRLMLLTARPARVARILPVPLPRLPAAARRIDPDFLAFQHQVWNNLSSGGDNPERCQMQVVPAGKGARQF